MGSEKRGRTLNLSPTLCRLRLMSAPAVEKTTGPARTGREDGINVPEPGCAIPLIAKDDAQERRMNFNFAVIFNEP
jgi:hypothetical protein